MLTIYLARHGETVENRAGILQGCTHGHLNEAGKEQVERLRRELEGLQFEAIVSSDLKRAMDSALILNKYFNLPVEECVLLRERDWGTLTGVLCEEAKKLERFPDSVETLEQGMNRAVEFINAMFEKYDGKKILAVGHGFINRCILAAAGGVARNEIPRIANAECRIIRIENRIPYLFREEGKDEASAN